MCAYKLKNIDLSLRMLLKSILKFSTIYATKRINRSYSTKGKDINCCLFINSVTGWKKGKPIKE